MKYAPGSKYFQRLELSVVREGEAPPLAITSPRQAADTARMFLQGDEDRETFAIITLNAKNRATGYHIVSVGSLSQTVVHPREVYKAAMIANAAGIIAVHNHPSGDPSPSKEDLAVTRRLVDAGATLGIEFKDNIILGDDCYLSFKEKGLL